MPRATKWIVGALLALDVALLLFALTFANITAQGPATRALGQSVAILTEADALAFRDLRRTADGFFVKLSYLFQL